MNNISIPYCPKCKGLAFAFDRTRTEYGTAHYRMEMDGYPSMEDFDCNESEEFEAWCYDCREEMPDEVGIPEEVYESMLKYVCEKDLNIFPFDIGDREPINIKPEEVKEIVVITLL